MKMIKQPPDFFKKIKETRPLRVYWIPQVPMKSLEISVPDVYTGKFLLTVLAEYDLFQFKNNIKPDHCNAGGLLVKDGEEWVDWIDDNTGLDIDSPEEDFAEIYE